MALAPSFPACTASTTSLPPFTASPPAKTPLILVVALSFSTSLPFLLSSLYFFTSFSYGTCPAAASHHIHLRGKCFPGVCRQTPARRIGFTEVSFYCRAGCFAFPFDPSPLAARQPDNFAAIGLALSSSHVGAGFSATVRQWTPGLLLRRGVWPVFAASMAVMPIPITATLSLPARMKTRWIVCHKWVNGIHHAFEFSPGISSLRAMPTPMAR